VPIRIFRSSRSGQGRGHKRPKNKHPHVSHGTAGLRQKAALPDRQKARVSGQA
jgi:hypothetical protein